MDDLGTALAQAESQIAAGRLNEARLTLNSTVERFPEHPWPVALLGRVALASGSHDEGRAHLLRAVKFGEPDALVFAFAAHFLCNDRDPSVDDLFRTGVALFPRDAAFVRLAITRAVTQVRPRGNRTVAVFGNCQAEAIQNLAAAIPLLAERFTFVMVPMQAPPGAVRHGIPASIERADLLWEQQGDHAEGPLFDEMHRMLPADCRVVRFPPICLLSCWPFGYTKTVRRTEPEFPWGRFPFADRIGDAVANLQLAPNRVFDAYMQLSREKMPDPSRLLERDRYLMRQLEANCEIKIVDYIDQTFRHRNLFWTWAHPTNYMMAEMLSRLYAFSAELLEGDIETFNAQLRIALEIVNEPTNACLPIHPDVIERLHLTHVSADSRYRWFGNEWTFEEYITRYITDDRSWGRPSQSTPACDLQVG